MMSLVKFEHVLTISCGFPPVRHLSICAPIIVSLHHFHSISLVNSFKMGSSQ